MKRRPRVYPLGTQRTTASARIREVWDFRLRVSERELVLDLAGVKEPPPNGAPASPIAERTWGQLEPDQVQRILITLRDIQQLGSEAAYALGYSGSGRYTNTPPDGSKKRND